MDAEPTGGRESGAETDRRPVAVGLILWLIATIVAATVSAVREIPPGVLWTCVAGLVMGVVGLLYVTRRAR